MRTFNLSPSSLIKPPLIDIPEIDGSKIKHGISSEEGVQIIKLSGLSIKEFMSATSLSESTIRRRLHDNGCFRMGESDLLYRLGELLKQAVDLFDGELSAAQNWLKKPVYVLGNKRPIDMLRTTIEFDQVRAAIGRLDHGVFQ